jgi:hypothetical protein
LCDARGRRVRERKVRECKVRERKVRERKVRERKVREEKSTSIFFKAHRFAMLPLRLSSVLPACVFFYVDFGHMLDTYARTEDEQLT